MVQNYYVIARADRNVQQVRTSIILDKHLNFCKYLIYNCLWLLELTLTFQLTLYFQTRTTGALQCLWRTNPRSDPETSPNDRVANQPIMCDVLSQRNPNIRVMLRLPIGQLLPHLPVSHILAPPPMRGPQNSECVAGWVVTQFHRTTDGLAAVPGQLLMTGRAARQRSRLTESSLATKVKVTRGLCGNLHAIVRRERKKEKYFACLHLN